MAFFDVLTRLKREVGLIQRGVKKDLVCVKRADLLDLLEQFEASDRIARNAHFAGKNLDNVLDHQIKDKNRLDFLDQINAEFNKRMGSSYGWAIDWNHNRIALHDMDPMRMTVRQAIDAKMQEISVKADGCKQEARY